MRQIRDMSIIEIDITNACHKQCSNCTRFCGHHKKPFFMDFDTFKRAVDSLQGYQGLVSTIGGEPLLHPEYDRFAAYLQKMRGKARNMAGMSSQAIVRDYLGLAKVQRWFEGAVNAGRGYLLFTSMPVNYYRHYESVQDTVTDLWLNDHTSPSFHQPILVSRKDLGIGDEEFAALRDACWLQNFWSAGITPKGAFFCEIAGTLDLLFDGPGGKPIEPGWWDRDLSEYADQFHWCDICGMALKTFSRNANDSIDDASPSLYDRLKKLDTPKFRHKQVALFDPAAGQKGNTHIGQDMATVSANYQPDNNLRVGDASAHLKPASIHAVLIITNHNDITALRDRLDSIKSAVDGFYLVAPRALQDSVQKILTERDDCVPIFVDFPQGRELRSGDGLVRTLQMCKLQDWLLLPDEEANLPAGFAAVLKNRYLNPGYLFLCRFGQGESVLLSREASALRRLGYDGLRECRSPKELAQIWGEKTHILEKDFESLPDVDIPRLREDAFAAYAEDEYFTEALRQRMQDCGIAPGAKLFVPQSAFVFHTLSIVRLLENMGYVVYVASNRKFQPYFNGWLAEERCHYFDISHFDYSTQAEFRKNLCATASFVGSVVPFSFGPSSIKYIDDYTDALRTAEEVGGRILAVINIRRQFIEPEYDIWAGDEQCL